MSNLMDAWLWAKHFTDLALFNITHLVLAVCPYVEIECLWALLSFYKKRED